MSDLVEDFLAREKDGLAGLEGDIPSAFECRIFHNSYFCDLEFSSIFLLAQSEETMKNSSGDGFDASNSYNEGEFRESFQ